MSTEEELRHYDHDMTGATFMLSSNTAWIGETSVKITPSGSADDTKLALPLSDKRLEKWIGYDQMAINIYLPEENYVNPSNFFLGMADITGGSWRWVEGIFWDEKDLHTGWNKITYTLPDEMKHLNHDNDYRIFIFFTAFMVPEEDGIKMPLYETFYIDGIRMI